jgi:polar amino acid transport system substrate-binding protein
MKLASVRVAVVVASLGLLAACSSSAKSANPPSSGGSTGPSTSQSSNPIRDLLPAAVKSKGSLTVATDATIGFPYAASAGGDKIEGLDVDLAQALGAVLGVDVTIKNIAFASLIPGIQAGRYDLAISAALDTLVREKQVDFVQFIKDGSAFLVKSGSSLKDLSLDKLCGVKVGALAGSAEAAALATQTATCTKDSKPAITISQFAALSDATLALQAGRIQVLAGGGLTGAYASSQSGGTVEVSGPLFGEAPVGIELPKDGSLTPAFQKAMQTLIDNGSYQTILAKYGAQLGAIKVAEVNKAAF